MPAQKLLSPTGSLYMVLVQENKPAEITHILEGSGLHSEVSVCVSGVGESRGSRLLTKLHSWNASLCTDHLSPAGTGIVSVVADSDRQTGAQRGPGDPAHPPAALSIVSMHCTGTGSGTAVRCSCARLCTVVFITSVRTSLSHNERVVILSKAPIPGIPVAKIHYKLCFSHRHESGGGINLKL